jgi:hypothetical protein
MKSKFFKLTALATTTLLSCAAMLPADTTFVELGVGYRQDSITLNVKERGGCNPQAKANRHFKDLEIVTVGTRLKTTFGCSDAYLRASFDWGFVVDGKVRDQLTVTDRNEVSQDCRSNHTVEGDYLSTTVHNRTKNSSYVWDLDIAFAYPMHCGCDDFVVAPAIGFTVDRQHLKVKGTTSFCDQAFSSKSSSSDAQKGHGSNYRASWWGPWLGFDFAYNSPDCWNVYGAFEFHFGRARRVANSHTNSNIDQYHHTKTFYGPLFRLGTGYMFCENWYVDANVSYQKFFSDTNRDNISWASAKFVVDVGYVF